MVYLAYPASAFLAHPDWRAAVHDTMFPQFQRTSEYLVMIIGLIGTTITPWMQFYLQASVVEKGITRQEYSLSRWDVILGCIFTDVIAFFIVVACAATIHKAGHGELTDVAQAAIALRPFAGKFASLLFAIGLINASLLSAAILPLATAYNICEGLGFESGIDKRFSDAPVFYWLYTILIGGGAAVVLFPKLPLLGIILLSQVANGILLPFVVTFMLILINRSHIMGDRKNTLPQNIIAWSTAIVMIALTLAMIWTTVAGA